MNKDLQVLFDNIFNKQFLGFDRHLPVMSNTIPTYPPYNIVKDKNSYILEVAVAGISREDIKIYVQEDVLFIEHRKPTKETVGPTSEQFVHRGIGKRDFVLKFALDNYLQVSEAKMENGILTISLEQKIPEEKLPKYIDITE